MTITTKIAKNGAINFYNAETGKRVAEAKVVDDAIENGGTFYTAKTLRYSGYFASKNFASPITAYKWLARTTDGSMEIVRCDRSDNKTSYSTIYQIGCDGGDELIESAELEAYLKEIRGTSGAFTEEERRETQIVLRMKSDNLNREQAEELVDYIRANREHYNSEVRANVKAMLDNFNKINNPLACLNNLGYEDDVIEPVYGTVDETASSQEYAVTIAQLKDAYDSAVDAWCTVEFKARTNKKLRPAVQVALATVNAAGTALQAFGDAHLSELSPLLGQTIRGATIRIINEDGIDWGSQKLADISLKFRRTGPDFAIIANDNYYATCATPDDVRRVVRRLTQAIVNGAPEFSFAPQDSTVADTPPAESDTLAAVARICATVNAAAPRGWEVYYDAPTNLFAIEHDGKPVTRLTSVELYDAWNAHPPEDFFDEFDLPPIEFDEHGDIIPWF